MKQITFKKILVTHDGSKLASAAIPYTSVLAALLDAEVLLLEVVPTVGQEVASLTPISVPPGIASSVSADGKIAKEIVRDKVKRAKKELGKIKEQLERSHVMKVSVVVKQGIAPSTIVQAAKSQHCDLIVISTHGRSGLGRALLGSVADYVIRHAPSPVLVVHPKGNKK